MEQIIRTENLSYKDFLHYPNIHIEKNKVTFISGESGCGKSTLLKLLNATVSPSKGTIFYDEKDISFINKIELRKEILLVKQVPYLFKGSVYENFMAFHEVRKSQCPSESEIKDLLKLCCIPASLETQQCETMSGGERQRIFLSVALSLNPRVLLLDEPTSALNKELSIQVLKNIIEYSRLQNISLVIISHDNGLQSMFAEKVIELRRI